MPGVLKRFQENSCFKLDARGLVYSHEDNEMFGLSAVILLSFISEYLWLFISTQSARKITRISARVQLANGAPPRRALPSTATIRSSVIRRLWSVILAAISGGGGGEHQIRLILAGRRSWAIRTITVGPILWGGGGYRVGPAGGSTHFNLGPAFSSLISATIYRSARGACRLRIFILWTGGPSKRLPAQRHFVWLS